MTSLLDPQWVGPAIAGSIFIVSLLLALIAYKLLFPLARQFGSEWTFGDLKSSILRATRLPVTFGIVVFGGYLAITVPLDLSPSQQAAASFVFGLLGLVLGIVVLASVVSNAISWYTEHIAPRTTTKLDDRLFPLLQRVTAVLIYVFGGLVILDHLNINISPLIAGLGLGGIAVALAIQPTLANLFAGTYVMTEGVVAQGDYIQLEKGVSGYVVDVGWRSTRLRTWSNNLVVVPNSKFAETIITNYQQPVAAVNVYLTCGVSYDSDLFQVEQICKEVMNELLETDPGAVKEYGGWFGFDNFGDSNVNFWLFLQAKDRLASFTVQSALIQKLHHRFQGEGIVINYPVRALKLPENWPPGTPSLPNVPASVPHINGTNKRRRAPRRRLPRDFHLGQGDAGPDI